MPSNNTARDTKKARQSTNPGIGERLKAEGWEGEQGRQRRAEWQLKNFRFDTNTHCRGVLQRKRKPVILDHPEEREITGNAIENGECTCGEWATMRCPLGIFIGTRNCFVQCSAFTIENTLASANLSLCLWSFGGEALWIKGGGTMVKWL